ncbi:MAG: AI-2E family transporter [Alphaproteobacteria bacterium]
MGEQKVTLDKASLYWIIATVVVITFAFLNMIQMFLVPLFLAAILSMLFAPIFRWFNQHLKNRPIFSSILTIFTVIIALIFPLFFIIDIIIKQTSEYMVHARTLTSNISQTSTADTIIFIEKLPFGHWIIAHQTEILTKVAEISQKIATIVLNLLPAIGQQAVSFFLSMFIMLYAMFFFLQYKGNLFSKLFAYTGLPNEIKDELSERVISISRATIKGTIIIGIVQGLLGGIGFALTGAPAPAFLGAVMAIASIIPGIGTAVVWIPVVIYLFMQGQTMHATILLAWSAGIVGTIDNILRPRLVGNDTKMPDLLILISTLGGISVFGAVGIILGPVIAGLFVSIWAVVKDHNNDIDYKIDDVSQAQGGSNANKKRA